MQLFLLLVTQPISPPTASGTPADSMVTDTAFHDTLDNGVQRVPFGADTVIFYSDTKDVLLLSNAWIEYGDIKVFSDSIRFSTQKRQLSAYNGVRLFSGRDSVIGTDMQYAVETQKGVMERGHTQIDKGYFYGEGIWLVEENTLYITRGYYTTCERNPPHYDFYGLELKVFLNDMVIARPVFLRVFRVPLLAAPFWYLPIGSERKSGLLPFQFSFAPNETEGWYVKKIRYFWAINDYAQALFSLDIMTKKGFRPGAEFEWKWGPGGAEYLAGMLSGSYINETDTRDQRWTFSLNNRSRIPDGTSVTADINFTSDEDYIYNYTADPDSISLDKILDRSTQSHLYLSRTLLGRPVSLSASRQDNLSDSTWSMTLPGFSFSWPTVNLGKIFNLSFGSFRMKNIYTHDDVWLLDTLTGDSSKTWSDHRTTSFAQPLSLSWGYSFIGAYTFAQSWNAGQNLTWADDSLIRGADYGLSTSFSTNFYRIFGIYRLGMNGVLHTVTPTVTHSITPATASVQPWLTYPRFDTALVGHSVSFSLGQTFQTKLRQRGDTTKFAKQNLLNLTTGIGYNLITKKFNPINASVNLPSGLPVYADLRLNYDIYTDSISATISANAHLDRLLFPLLGLKTAFPDKDTADTLGVSEFDSLTLDSLPRDSLLHEHEKKETFAQRFARSRIYLGSEWGVAANRSGVVDNTVSNMLTLNTDFYLPLDMELRFSVAANLSERHSDWRDYIAYTNLSISKGLHCWEAVFEVRPNLNTQTFRLDDLNWNLYLRIKEIPEIEVGKGFLERWFGGG